MFHNLWFVVRKARACEWLTPTLTLAMFVAALCHDIDHPGHTNAFEINISSELAIMYSDDSVLEHHHAATTFRVLRGGVLVH